MDIVKDTIIGMVVFIISGSIHEFAHAFSAYILGDDTARLQGRLTLNPMVHVDIFGSILFPILSSLTGFYIYGWMKPVPVSGQGFKNPSRDHALVAFAGPLSNLIQVSLGIIFLKICFTISSMNPGISNNIVFSNILLFFNYYFVINIILFIFNLIPCPPLDGGWIIRHFLPEKAKEGFDKFYKYGFILLFILLFTGLLKLLMNFMIHLFSSFLIMIRDNAFFPVSFLPLVGVLLIAALLFRKELLGLIKQRNAMTPKLATVELVPETGVVLDKDIVTCNELEFGKNNIQCRICDNYLNCFYKGKPDSGK